MMDGSEWADEVGEEMIDDEEAFLYKYAILVPGMLHIILNLLRDMHATFPDWGEIWKQLKKLEAPRYQ